MNQEEIQKCVDRVLTFYKNTSLEEQKTNNYFFFKEGGLAIYINLSPLNVVEVEPDYYVDKNMIAFKLDNPRTAEEILERLGIYDTSEKLSNLYYSSFGNKWLPSKTFWFIIKPFVNNVS